MDSIVSRAFFFMLFGFISRYHTVNSRKSDKLVLMLSLCCYGGKWPNNIDIIISNIEDISDLVGMAQAEFSHEPWYTTICTMILDTMLMQAVDLELYSDGLPCFLTLWWAWLTSETEQAESLHSSRRQQEEEEVKIVEIERKKGWGGWCFPLPRRQWWISHRSFTVQQSWHSVTGVTSHVRYLLL